MLRMIAALVGGGLTIAAWTMGPVNAAGAHGAGTARAGESTTWTGFFSDKGCAKSKVARGDITPNNAVCVARCLDDGATAVFMSEQAKAMFDVTGYATTKIKEDLGYHLEVTGIVDADAKTIAVTSVKRLEYVGAMCGLPKKPAPAKPAREAGAARPPAS